MRLNISQEMIDFQKNDNFGKKIEEVVQEAIDFCISLESEYKLKDNLRNTLIVNKQTIDIRKELNDSNLPNKLASIVFVRTGLKINFSFNIANFNASILPLFINKNNILLHKYIRGLFTIEEQEKFIKDAILNNKKGYVNLKTAKVSGVFSEYIHTCQVDIYGFFRNMSSTKEQITAVILHEIGHAFTTLEYSDRLESTNQAIATMVNNLKNKNDKSFVYDIKELKNSLGLSDEDINELQNEKNRVILGFKLFERYVGFIKSQLPKDYYDTSSSEQMADSFSSRFGYGRYLVEWEYNLEKLVQTPDVSKASRIITSIAITIQHSAVFLSIIANAFLGSFFIATLASVLLIMIILFSGESFINITYDHTRDRYKRIRNEYIEMIKSLSLDRQDLLNIIESVEVIDAIMNKVVIYRNPIQRLSNFIFKFHRNTKDDMELQQLIEELSSNDIFLKSAQIQTL